MKYRDIEQMFANNEYLKTNHVIWEKKNAGNNYNK